MNSQNLPCDEDKALWLSRRHLVGQLMGGLIGVGGVGAAAALMAEDALFPPAFAALNAGQLSHQRWRKGDQEMFSYKMEDRRGRHHEMRFGLPYQTVQTLSRSLPGINAPQLRGRLDREIERAKEQVIDRRHRALKAAIGREQANLPNGVTMKVDYKANGGYEYSLHTKSNIMDRQSFDRLNSAIGKRLDRFLRDREVRDQKEFDLMVQQRYRQILSDHFYQLDRRTGKTNFISFDYPRIAAHHQEAMAAVSYALMAMTQSRNPRRKLEAALLFLQSIPYNELRGKDQNGNFSVSRTGFAQPVEMLTINQGDCDSKSTALAAMMPSLLPQNRAIMVILPRHALLGIDLPVRGSERHLRHGGRTYLLVETAGPGQFPPGQIFPDSDSAIKAGRIERIIPMTSR